MGHNRQLRTRRFRGQSDRQDLTDRSVHTDRGSDRLRSRRGQFAGTDRGRDHRRAPCSDRAEAPVAQSSRYNDFF